MKAETLLKRYNAGQRDFTGAILSGVNLRHLALPGIDLSNARLERADLSYANLNGARLRDIYADRAQFDSAAFVGADLSHADLQDSFMTNADFTEANLTGTDLTGADLEDARFRGAIIHEITLYKANLYGARQITSLGPVGFHRRILYAVLQSNGTTVMVKAGCSYKHSRETLLLIASKYGDTATGKAYCDAVRAMVKVLRAAG